MVAVGYIAGVEEPVIVPEAIVTEKNEEHKLLFGTRMVTIIDAIRRDAKTAPIRAGTSH